MNKFLRIMLAIDGGNSFYMKKMLGWQIDFGKLLSYLEKRFTDPENTVILCKAIFYNGLGDTMRPREVRFHKILESMGISLYLKPLKKIMDKRVFKKHKGSLDVEITVDAMRNIAHYDVFVLLSGDSDFVYLLKYLREQGKRILVISTWETAAVEIKDEAGLGNYLDIKSIREKIEYR
jgi:uncharacterized LabA/DUF88 family protein